MGCSKIYHRVEQLAGHNVSSNLTAWDLYSGIGIFSLILARSGYKVMGIEENPLLQMTLFQILKKITF